MAPQPPLRALLASPKPFDKPLRELLAYPGLRQGDLVAATGLNKTATSCLVNGKSSSSLETLDKLHTAFTTGFGVPPDLLTLDYLLACQDMDPEDALSPRVSNLNAGLNRQPEAVQNGFWAQADAFIRIIESLRERGEG